jgi:hypothetical protein
MKSGLEISANRAVVLSRLATVLMICGSATCQAQSKLTKQSSATGPAGSLEAVVAGLWPKITFICPVNTNGQIENMTFFLVDSNIVEVSRPWRKLLSENITEKDRLNGIQSRAWAVLGGGAYRFRYGSIWGPWKDFEQFANVQSTQSPSYVFTTVAVEMKHGKWTFSTWNGTAGNFNWSDEFDPNHIPANRPSCDVLTSERRDQK